MPTRSPSLRVALVAISARGALAQYVEALSDSLHQLVDLHLFVPGHYGGSVQGSTPHPFRTGASKWRAAGRLSTPSGARRVWREIRSIQPDVIHVFSGEGYPWSWWWSRWNRVERIPFLVTVHDVHRHPRDPVEWLSDRLQRYVMRHAASVHVHCEAFVRDARRRSGSRVVVIPHGSLAPRFLCHARPSVPREPLVLFFGRVRSYKGVDLLVDAAEHLSPDLRIAIAGPGRLPWPVSHTLRRRGDRFEVHNRLLADAEVAHLFQRACVCVLPYRQATQSSVPLIAAGFGVPVVATALGGFVEDIPRVGGVLVKPDDARALAAGIVEARSRTAVHPAELSFDRTARQYADWYASALERRDATFVSPA
jgi:glycosyltransferase involved in cell wall biosynthesis